MELGPDGVLSALAAQCLEGDGSERGEPVTVSLLRAKRYRWGLGSSARSQSLERSLKVAEQRLRDHLLRERDTTFSGRSQSAGTWKKRTQRRMAPNYKRDESHDKNRQ